MKATANTELAKRNKRVALMAGSLVVIMVALAFASVPLYDLFCRVTGYGGTTRQIATGDTTPIAIGDRVMTIRFDAGLHRDMGWRFKAPAKPINLRLGESGLAFYTAENIAAETITGTAGFNVTPHAAGYYVAKLDCFCFTEQTLKAGERVDMPVSFFIDPEIRNDPETRNIKTITLSYTFFRAKTSAHATE